MLPLVFTLIVARTTLPVPPPVDAETPEAEQLVFLLEYIAIDYGLAVQHGEIIDELEYREMQAFSQALVDNFDVFWQLGASEETRAGLGELQDRIRRRRPCSTSLIR